MSITVSKIFFFMRLKFHSWNNECLYFTQIKYLSLSLLLLLLTTNTLFGRFSRPRLCNYTYFRLKRDNWREQKNFPSVKEKSKGMHTQESRLLPRVIESLMYILLFSYAVIVSSLSYYNCNSCDECYFSMCIDIKRNSSDLFIFARFIFL